MAYEAPVAYEIHVAGSVGDSWVNWFDDIVTTRYSHGATLLTTRPIDQETLVGIITAIHDFNCRLVSLNPVVTGSDISG